MEPHSGYYNRKLSGSYSRRVEKQKQRLTERRVKLGIPLRITSRREYWAKYPSLIRELAELVEEYYRKNGGFNDREQFQKFFCEHTSKTPPFISVIRHLPDNIYSDMWRLPFSGELGEMSEGKNYRIYQI